MYDAHLLSGWWWDESRSQSGGEDGEYIAQWSLADFPEIVPAERAPS
jgi:hypothetical protein